MNKIYYFTGTGNSLQIAEDVSRGIGECTIYKIAGYAGENINSDTLGIVFPVYNWGMPLILCDFLEKLNVSNDIYIYMRWQIMEDFQAEPLISAGIF